MEILIDSIKYYMDLFKINSKGNVYELEIKDFTEYWNDFTELYRHVSWYQNFTENQGESCCILCT